jgi:hypothetical protein
MKGGTEKFIITIVGIVIIVVVAFVLGYFHI